MFLINEYNRNLSMKDQAIKTKKTFLLPKSNMHNKKSANTEGQQ